MDVTLYLLKRRGQVRMMPGNATAGIRYTGQVLNGERAVEAAVRESGMPVSTEPAYKRLADYDAVLKSHCRLPRG